MNGNRHVGTVDLAMLWMPASHVPAQVPVLAALLPIPVSY